MLFNVKTVHNEASPTVSCNNPSSISRGVPNRSSENNRTQSTNKQMPGSLITSNFVEENKEQRASSFTLTETRAQGSEE